ncbi:hypothetical protein [Alkalibaculum bacchi]|uniref:hypothetical protein n=1 Tax=Alkalibaculum bacchi TaxID=645887 RepID=UPI0026F23599|nr:hypothetical protein [Alkalibaculum bacchi]
MNNLENQAILLGAKLTEIAIRNTTETIINKVSAVKAKKDDKETINVLEEIINDLIKDKNDLVQVSRAYEEEFIMRKISEDDLVYITENLIPVLNELFITLMGFKTIDDENTLKIEEIQSLMKILHPILSTETLKILQLLGFDFKSAIGEPLTELLRNLILSKTISNNTNMTEIITPEVVELLKNKSAFDNFIKFTKGL